jgi:hypothetical protein
MMERASHEGSLLYLPQIVLIVNGITADSPPMQGVKDLRTCLGSIGLYAMPRIRAVSGAAKHPSGA